MTRRTIFVGCAIAIVAITLILWALLFQPFSSGSGGPRVIVSVPRGAGLAEVSDLLESRGVIDDPLLFQVRARLSGDAGRLHAGPIEFREGMTYGQALDALTEQGNALKSVTIPEGPSRGEVSRLVAASGVSGSYLASSRSSSLLDPRSYGAPPGATLEGFLFPSTYELKLPPAARDLVAAQLNAFRREFAKVDLARAKSKNLSAYDVVTIASMVERETAIPAERPVVAAVIWNRLRERIPLGIDATTRYQFSNWTRPLRVSELESDSPWNTRRRQGLPPGPIGNPGLAALKAAANPAPSSALYYVVKPWTCGEHEFSGTQAGFDRAVAAYNAARNANGGKAPTKCP